MKGGSSEKEIRTTFSPLNMPWIEDIVVKCVHKAGTHPVSPDALFLYKTHRLTLCPFDLSLDVFET